MWYRFDPTAPNKIIANQVTMTERGFDEYSKEEYKGRIVDAWNNKKNINFAMVAQ